VAELVALSTANETPTREKPTDAGGDQPVREQQAEIPDPEHGKPAQEPTP